MRIFPDTEIFASFWQDEGGCHAMVEYVSLNAERQMTGPFHAENRPALQNVVAEDVKRRRHDASVIAWSVGRP